MEPVRSYVICCVQRTGSWLLAHTLADTGYAGRPSDYFDDAERENHTREWGLPTGDLTAYVRALRDKATTPNGVFGSKLMWNDFDWLRSSLHPPAGTDAGLEFMRTSVPEPSVRLAAACGQSAAGHLVVASGRDRSVGPAARPGG